MRNAKNDFIEKNSLWSRHPVVLFYPENVRAERGARSIVKETTPRKELLARDGRFSDSGQRGRGGLQEGSSAVSGKIYSTVWTRSV